MEHCKKIFYTDAPSQAAPAFFSSLLIQHSNIPARFALCLRVLKRLLLTYSSLK